MEIIIVWLIMAIGFGFAMYQFRKESVKEFRAEVLQRMVWNLFETTQDIDQVKHLMVESFYESKDRTIKSFRGANIIIEDNHPAYTQFTVIKDGVVVGIPRLYGHKVH